jgi:hypothetical protein
MVEKTKEEIWTEELLKNVYWFTRRDEWYSHHIAPKYFDPDFPLEEMEYYMRALIRLIDEGYLECIHMGTCLRNEYGLKITAKGIARLNSRKDKNPSLEKNPQ